MKTGFQHPNGKDINPEKTGTKVKDREWYFCLVKTGFYWQEKSVVKK